MCLQHFKANKSIFRVPSPVVKIKWHPVLPVKEKILKFSCPVHHCLIWCLILIFGVRFIVWVFSFYSPDWPKIQYVSQSSLKLQILLSHEFWIYTLSLLFLMFFICFLRQNSTLYPKLALNSLRSQRWPCIPDAPTSASEMLDSPMCHHAWVIFLQFFICFYVWGYTHGKIRGQLSGVRSVLWNQVIRLGSKYPYPLSHTASTPGFLKICMYIIVACMVQFTFNSDGPVSSLNFLYFPMIVWLLATSRSKTHHWHSQ